MFYTAEINLATIADRMAVKKAVQSGNVQDAIEKVNDLNPEVKKSFDNLGDFDEYFFLLEHSWDKYLFEQCKLFFGKAHLQIGSSF